MRLSNAPLHFPLDTHAYAHILRARMHALIHIRKVVFGLTQKDFAEAVKVHQSTVSRWETGELCPSSHEMGAIRDLAKARGIEWDDRWFFEPPADAAD